MRRPALAPATVALALVSGACGGPHSALRARSEAADGIAALWWLLFWVCLAVFLVVVGLYAYALLRRRPSAGAAPEPEGGMRTLIVVGGAVVPALILLGLTVATVRTSSLLAPRGPAALEVQVVGHQFWWEVRYPEAGAVTANEIHVPVGLPTRLTLTTSDVIHSFWVPQLHGKFDMTPGRRANVVIEPRQAGIYRGFCAEFCGAQHALMGLLLVAQPEDEFRAWLEAQAAPAPPPANAERAAGERVFVDYGCAVCHRVRGAGHGTPAEVGPDLTHVASRRTLGAATVPNRRANLAAWVLDPHRTKPGVRMPATLLDADELHALVGYLEGLR